jgi:mono/diheme cytochrome c family protein
LINSLYRQLNALGFTDPIHSPMTHIPIGLVIGAFVFFAVALIFKRKQLVLTARYVSILALIFVFPTILFGVFDWIHFYHAAPMPAIKVKMALAAALIVLLVVGIVLGGRAKPHNGWMMIIYALCLFDVVGLGYFGAGIIYGRDTGAVKLSAAASTAPDARAQAVPAQTQATSAAAPTAPASATPAGDAKLGRRIFADNCEGCHTNGGNVFVSTLPVRGSKKLSSLDGFIAFIRNPTMPNGSQGSMPPFPASALSASGAKDLYAYVTKAWK